MRAADIEYKLPGEASFRMTTRPIHKLVMVLPVEEQAVASEQGREEVTRAEESTPLAIGEPEQPQQEEGGSEEVGGDPPSELPQETPPQPVEGE